MRAHVPAVGGRPLYASIPLLADITYRGDSERCRQPGGALPVLTDFVDADQVAGSVAECAVADAVRLLGGFLYNVSAAGL